MHREQLNLSGLAILIRLFLYIEICGCLQASNFIIEDV
jgi:hypothetical protein